MFTKQEKDFVLRACTAYRVSIARARAKAKYPEFAVVYDREEVTWASVMMKLQALEVSDERKVAARS